MKLWILIAVLMRRVAITYRAGSAGQTLRVRYIQGAGNMEGNVSFQAATLTGILP